MSKDQELCGVTGDVQRQDHVNPVVGRESRRQRHCEPVKSLQMGVRKGTQEAHTKGKTDHKTDWCW